MLAGAGHGYVEGNPVAAELLHAIRSFRLPVEPMSRLIEEHQFDLYNDPMPSMAALEGYLNETASALFALAARVTARPSEEIEHLARHAFEIKPETTTPAVMSGRYPFSSWLTIYQPT